MRLISFQKPIFCAFTLPALATCYLMVAHMSAEYPWLQQLFSQNDPATQVADAAPAAAEPEELALPKQPIEERVVSVDKGDTLQSVLTDADVDSDEAYKAVASMKNVFNMKTLRHGQDIKLIFDNRGTEPVLTGFSFTPDASRTINVMRAGKEYVAKSQAIPVTKQAQGLRGTINGSLAGSARKAGVPQGAVAEMVKAFSYDVDFQRDLHKGDGFEVLFEQFINENGQMVKSGNLLYAALTVDGKPMRVFRFDDGNKVDYYNEKGVSIHKSLLRTPVDGARITSGFGMRMHPVLGYSKMHKGVDFGVGYGTPILAAGDGVIEQANFFGSYGNYVKIRHNKDYSTAYAHMSKFAKNIKKGGSIRQGQVIGYVGSTGRSTGAHCHFEVIKDGSQINPAKATMMANNQLEGKKLAQFKSTIVQRRMQFAAMADGTPKVASNNNKSSVE